MNPENNNFDNSLESQSFGTIPQEPVNPQMGGIEPAMNVPGPQPAPFENLNNEALNVPQDNTFNPAPVDPSTFNAEVTQAPVTDAVPQQDTLNVTPEVAPVDIASEIAATPAPQMTPEIVPAEGEAYESPLDQTITINPSQPIVSDDLNNNLGAMPQADAVTGPTLPIPDQMPTDYQATVSTPVDYATPMSDFDQIGSTPELDPKQKSKKTNTKKTLLFCLLIIAIAALGSGAYYLINVKGILNSKDVVTKDLEVESGSVLSTSIDDYGTFKKTSSSNCVVDTTNVNVKKAGKYTYTITCGTDTYNGTVTVVDKTAPILSFNIVQTRVNIPVSEKELVASTLEEGETYAFTSASDAEQAVKTAGLNFISLTSSDEAGNKQTYYAPVSVLSSDLRYSISGTKLNQADGTTERLIIFCNNDMICEGSYKAQIIVFNSEAEFNSIVKSYKGETSLTYNDYTGTPLFYPSENKLVIITNPSLDFGAKTAPTVYTELMAEGYNMNYSTDIGVNKDVINFDI